MAKNTRIVLYIFYILLHYTNRDRFLMFFSCHLQQPVKEITSEKNNL
jgi:hypothetical protein